MKFPLRLLTIIVLTLFIGGLFIKNTLAQETPITDQQIEKIVGNCLITKDTLTRLHVSDAVLRVNVGQIYESIATKLMEGFNSRVSSNNFNEVDLVSATKNYQSMLDTFRSDYKIYEEKLSNTLAIDCSKQPVEFYSAVLLDRTNRNQVRSDVINLNQLIDQYRLSVAQFEKDFQDVSNGGKK